MMTYTSSCQIVAGVMCEKRDVSCSVDFSFGVFSVWLLACKSYNVWFHSQTLSCVQNYSKVRVIEVFFLTFVSAGMGDDDLDDVYWSISVLSYLNSNQDFMGWSLTLFNKDLRVTWVVHICQGMGWIWLCRSVRHILVQQGLCLNKNRANSAYALVQLPCMLVRSQVQARTQACFKLFSLLLC